MERDKSSQYRKNLSPKPTLLRGVDFFPPNNSGRAVNPSGASSKLKEQGSTGGKFIGHGPCVQEIFHHCDGHTPEFCHRLDCDSKLSDHV